MNKNRIPYLEKSSSNPSLPMNRVVTSTSDFVLEEDDPQVIYVAKSIAEQAMGRAWDDFLPLNAHDIDQSDLIDFAKAAISALGSPVVSQPQVEAELVHKSSPGEPVAWRYFVHKEWRYTASRNEVEYLAMGGHKAQPLFAAPQPVACPDGWKLVPVEPTEAMIESANYKRPIPDHWLTDAWSAMLAAAPSFEKNSEAQG